MSSTNKLFLDQDGVIALLQSIRTAFDAKTNTSDDNTSSDAGGVSNAIKSLKMYTEKYEDGIASASIEYTGDDESDWYTKAYTRAQEVGIRGTNKIFIDSENLLELSSVSDNVSINSALGIYNTVTNGSIGFNAANGQIALNASSIGITPTGDLWMSAGGSVGLISSSNISIESGGYTKLNSNTIFKENGIYLTSTWGSDFASRFYPKGIYNESYGYSLQKALVALYDMAANVASDSSLETVNSDIKDLKSDSAQKGEQISQINRRLDEIVNLISQLASRIESLEADVETLKSTQS